MNHDDQASGLLGSSIVLPRMNASRATVATFTLDHTLFCIVLHDIDIVGEVMNKY